MTPQKPVAPPCMIAWREQSAENDKTMSDTTQTAELSSVDILKVLKLLPHRYPFLLVDRIKDIKGDDSCIGIKNVTINEPFFQGHFPQFPIMPGVLLIEGMAQTAGALCVHHIGATEKPPLVYFMAIDKAKFRQPVVPGDRVEFHVEKRRHRGRVWRFYCEARVEGKLVAEAEVSAMITQAEVEEFQSRQRSS